jgi:hypothetical protein
MLNLNYNVIGSQRDKTVRGSGIPFQDFIAEVLAVAGGGRGGEDIGGGGGAGGYKYNSNYYVSSSGTYTVVIGAGENSWLQDGGVCLALQGNGGISGSNTYVRSTIDGTDFYTKGGGAASCGQAGPPGNQPFNGSPGGSGGGGRGAGLINVGGAGFTDSDGFIQGYAGGDGSTLPTVNGGGGGGASQAGGNAGGGNGYGGRGKADLTLPSASFVAGGGDGTYSPTPSGSVGGGGWFGISGTRIAENGQPNTGGGGGALYGATVSGSYDTGAGGSGKVQFRYTGPTRATGGQIYEQKNVFGDVLFTVHTFTASGVFAPIR